MANSQESAEAYQEAHLGDNKKTEIIAPTVIFLVIAYTAVYFRYKSRRIARLKLETDDWCIGIGLILTTCFIIVYYLSILYGMGRHEILIKDRKGWVIMSCQLPTLIFGSMVPVTDKEQVTLSTQTLYSTSLCIVKLSILFFYNRIFGFPKPMFRYVLLATGGFVVAYGVGGILGTTFQCVPLSDLWKPPSNSPPACHTFSFALVVAMGVVNIVTDITTLSLPIPLVWSLQVSKSRKWQLVAVFSLGGFVCIISIIRLCFLRVGSWDASYDSVKGITLSAIECCVGILSACLPTYRPLWRKYGCVRTRRKPIANEFQSSELRMLNCAIVGSPWEEGTPRIEADGKSAGSDATCQV